MLLGKIGVPHMLASGRLYTNFYARLSPRSDDCRRRLEKALDLKAPGLLGLLLKDFEHRLVSTLNEAQRQAYFKGELDQEVIRKACAETPAEAPRCCSMARSTSSDNPRGPDGT